VKFGVIDVKIEFIPGVAAPEELDEVQSDAPTEAFNIGEFQFAKKTEVLQPAVKMEGTDEDNPD